MDGEILSHAHLNWISDQPSPLRKLAIHFGSQLAHPAVVCNDWLVEWPPGPVAGYDDDRPDLAALGDLAFRLRVAMLGSFGISARIDLWPAGEHDLAAAHVALYRERIRRLVHHGDQYFLTRGPRWDGEGEWAAMFYAAKDGAEGVLFAFRLGGAPRRSFRLPGLREGRLRATPFGGARHGLPAPEITVALAEEFRSELVLIEAG
jgi:hypothetical protein